MSEDWSDAAKSVEDWIRSNGGSLKRERPRVVESFTYKQESPDGTMYITIGVDAGGQPIEVFVIVGKSGSRTNALLEALGRSCSMLLQIASPVPPIERLKILVRQFERIGGGESVGFGKDRVTSGPDGVAKVFADFIEEWEGGCEQAASVPR